MTTDKLDTHYFQQLSALMDGDLAADQARFLLRRMQHDTELTACLERWQLCGDALRGQARAPAPAGFADRVANAIAAGSASAEGTAPALNRRTLARWGGGALAASVAVIALFMVRQQVPDDGASQVRPAVAGQAAGSTGPQALASPATQAATPQTNASVTTASVAVANVPRRQADSPRRSATRNQQAARGAAMTRDASGQVASADAVPVVHAIARAPATTAEVRDPFSGAQASAPSARPWPRAVLPRYSSGSGGFNADYSTDRATQAFYPFEPRLQSGPPITPPAEAPARDR